MPKSSNRRNPIPLILMIAGGLLLISAGIWTFSISNPTTPAAKVPVEAEDSYPQIARVSLADAKSAYDSGSALFLDVRDAESYAASHIPGALNIPLEELPQRFNELDTQAWIITYCT